MLFLACDLAIYRRLTGFPLDSMGRPVLDLTTGKPVNTSIIGPSGQGNEPTRLPSYGVRIPVLKSPQKERGDLSTMTPDVIRLYSRGFEPRAFKQVPVFFEGIDGRDWSKVFPCVVVRSAGFEYRRIGYTPYATLREEDPNADDITVTDELGNVIATGKSSYLERPHPDPYDLSYVVTAYAKNKIELGFICEQLNSLLPPHTAIEVERMNGEVLPFDFLLESIRSVGTDDTMALEGERYYAVAHTYTVEAFSDNSANEFGSMDITAQAGILTQILELADLQGTLLEHPFDVTKTG